MKNLVMKCLALFGLLFLTACGAQEGKIVPFYGGSKAGGFDAQVGCSSVLDAAGCMLATRTAGGRIDLHGKVIKDSTQGKVVAGLATAGPLKLLDWGIARDLQNNAPDCGNNCGSGTVVTVVNELVAIAEAESTSTNTSPNGCPPTGCPVLGNLE